MELTDSDRMIWSIPSSGTTYYKMGERTMHAVLLLKRITSKCWSHRDTLRSAGWLESIVTKIDVAGLKADALSRDFAH